MTISFRDSFTATEFYELAQRVWPGNYTVENVESALERTINIGAFDGPRLVGSVRVLTDSCFFATVPELLVLTDYRRQGIGRELMRRAVVVAPRKRLFFGAQPDAVAFFDSIGCKRTLIGFELYG